MNLKELLISHEGKRNEVYRCSAGHRTIGVGWNLDANPLPRDIQAYLDEHGCLNDACIDRLLDISIGWATKDCHDLFPDFDYFTENRQMALIDFVFQLGRTKALRFSKSIAAINTGRWEDAALNLSRSLWYEQVPNRAEEICKLIEEG